MKKKCLRTAAVLAIALGALAATTACSQWDSRYSLLDEQGYTVSVRYDINGGVFAGTNDVYVVDVFNLDDMKTNQATGMKEAYLVKPDDKEARGPLNAFEVSRTGYYFAGWYRERMGDEETGYTYSGKWDFDSDVLSVDPNGSYQSAVNELTLYAAWIPFRYEFYAVDEASGEVASQPYATHDGIEITVPAWVDGEAKLDMKNFPKRDGMTFKNAYLSSDLSTPMSGVFNAVDEYLDEETGTASCSVIRVYTTWQEGEWYKIYTPEQLSDTAKASGRYELCADLDFSDELWPTALSKTKFTGTIEGNGHKISNVSITQADASQVYGGLFGSIDATATIKDLTLENITYTIQTGSRAQGASFGLLTGSLAENATLENVTISGVLQIKEGYILPADHGLGLLCGMGETHGLDISGIRCEILDGQTGEVLAPDTGSLRVEIDANGEITLITQ